MAQLDIEKTERSKNFSTDFILQRKKILLDILLQKQTAKTYFSDKIGITKTKGAV